MIGMRQQQTGSTGIRIGTEQSGAEMNKSVLGM